MTAPDDAATYEERLTRTRQRVADLFAQGCGLVEVIETLDRWIEACGSDLGRYADRFLLDTLHAERKRLQSELS